MFSFCFSLTLHYLCNVKLSIVIPVYNVEDTLARCVESVLGQSFNDYEIILVDDGSPDHSGALCDQYAHSDDRIKVIHQSNGGLSSARNAGITISQGEYITFIDSDDFIGENTLSILMSRLSAHPDYDILEYPVCWHYGGEDETIHKYGIHEYHDMSEYWLDGKGYSHSYACNKIFARRLFDHVRFPVGRMFEDTHTLPQLLKEANLLATTEEGLYYYTSNPEGITMNPGGKGLTDLLEAHVSQLHDLGLTSSITEYFTHVLNIQLDVYAATKQHPILPIPPLSRKGIRSLPVGFKTKIKLRILQLLGIEKLCILHRLFHPTRNNP